MDVKFKASTFEFLCCRVTQAAANTILVAIYHPGSQPTSTTFFEEFFRLFELLATYAASVTITGEINIHFELTTDIDTGKLKEALTSFGFDQFVSSPTHELGAILDIIITPCDHQPEDVTVVDVGLSDHMLVSWSVNMAPPLPDYVTTTRRSWRTFKSVDFISRLRSTAL